MKKSIDLRANGKLLLTGEYLVMAGAKALAMPVRFGQSMHIGSETGQIVHWISREKGLTWFACDIIPGDPEIGPSTDLQVAERLSGILRAAKELNPDFLKEKTGLEIIMEANYPLKWGLGSSSTLIALIAEWAGVDKFMLFRKVSAGSGYDIACTDRNSLFFYQLAGEERNMGKTVPGRGITDYACFAYLGKKQETAGEVSAFLSGKNYTGNDIDSISELSVRICQEDEPVSLCNLVNEHEKILGRILKKERIMQRFPGFPGAVKSLGAWGGDFALFASERGKGFIKAWLNQKGLHDVFTYDELVVLT